MPRTLTSVWFAFLVVWPCSVLGELCQSQKNCHDCEQETALFSSDKNCRWCELDRKCHTVASALNPCKQFMNIKDDSECPQVPNVTVPYDQEKAVFFAQLSAVAYAEPGDLKRCFRSVSRTFLGADFEFMSESGFFPMPDFEFMDYIARQCNIKEINYKDCFVFIGISSYYKNIVISFRGTTDSDQLMDELYNSELQTLNDTKVKTLNDTKVNTYFKNALTMLYPCLLNNLKNLLLNFSDYDVVVTGHSLGGAIASLAAFSLVTEGVIAKEKLHVFTFGMPRVGNKNYAYNYDKFVRNSWRIIHDKDLIPRLPFTSLGYYHHRTPVLYGKKMGPDQYNVLHTSVYYPYTQFTDNEDSTLYDGILSISDHKEYFGIKIGTYCEETVKQKRSTRFQFPEDHCLVVSLRDADELPSTAALNIIYEPLLYTTVGVLMFTLHVL